MDWPPSRPAEGISPGWTDDLRDAARYLDLRVRAALAQVRAVLVSAPPTWSVFTAAALLGIWAVIIYYRADLLLSNADGIGHLHVARRTIDSVTPSFTQLGSIWLPLPHVLMLPFIWNDTLWHTGLAGSIVSVAAFALATAYVYRTVLAVTKIGVAAVVVAAIFATNPNLLYMQATPMTEALTIFFLVAATYHLLRWAQDYSLFHFIVSATFVLGGTLTRYETWILVPAGAAIVAIASYRRHRDIRQVEGLTLAWGVMASYGIVLWLLYNQIIFGNAMYFSSGDGSGAQLANELSAQGILPTAHNPVASTLAYGWAVLDNIGLPLALAGVAGCVALLASRLPLHVKAAALLPASLFLFGVFTLTNGENVLWTPQTEPSGFYNLRYGLFLLPAACFAAAYLVRAHRWVGGAVLLIVLVPQLLTLPGPGLRAPAVGQYTKTDVEQKHSYIVPGLAHEWSAANLPFFARHQPITLVESTVAAASAEDSLGEAPRWLGDNATTGKILMSEWHSTSALILLSGLHISRFISEGNKPFFEEELGLPGRYADWIIYQPQQPHDKVRQRIDEVGFPGDFQIVFDNETIRILHKYEPKPEWPRPPAVPDSARQLYYDAYLGRRDLARSARVVTGLDCGDGVVAVYTSMETVYAEGSCDRVPPKDELIGRPVYIEAKVGRGARLSLYLDREMVLRLAVQRVWLATP